jgi:acetoacetate decarboxylase
MMTFNGRITPDKMRAAMPVDAPLYANPPIYYKRAEAVGILYETDAEAALDLLPEGLNLPQLVTAALLFLKYPFSTLGPYEEAILGINCLLDDQPRFYIPHIVVNNDIPMAAGREIWGYPKKMADIMFVNEVDMVWGKMERPTGHPICSAGIRPEMPMEMEETGGGSLALRVIPSPEEGATPSLAELIEVPPNMTTHEAWAGPGWIDFNSESSIDPWHKLPVKEIIAATYRVYDQVLGFGKVVKQY